MNIKDAVLALGNVKSIEGMPLQGALAYKIKKFQDKYVKEYNILEPLKVEIFKRFGKENKGKIEIIPEKLPEFQAEIQKFYETETETDAPLLDVGKVDGVSASHLTVLEKNGIIKEIE